MLNPVRKSSVLEDEVAAKRMDTPLSEDNAIKMQMIVTRCREQLLEVGVPMILAVFPVVAEGDRKRRLTMVEGVMSTSNAPGNACRVILDNETNTDALDVADLARTLAELITAREIVTEKLCKYVQAHTPTELIEEFIADGCPEEKAPVLVAGLCTQFLELGERDDKENVH